MIIKTVQKNGIIKHEERLWIYSDVKSQEITVRLFEFNKLYQI